MMGLKGLDEKILKELVVSSLQNGALKNEGIVGVRGSAADA